MKYISNILLLLFLLLVPVSCEKFLDATESNANEIDGETVFSDFNSYREFVNYLYQGLTDYYSYEYNYLPGVASDELQWACSDWKTMAPHSLIAGDYWSGERNTETTWKYIGPKGNKYGRSPLNSAYEAIRTANMTIENIDKLNDERKGELLGQAYFFRAWFHFEIIRRVGGMPYIDHVLTTDEDMDFARESYRQCTDKIVADCRKAAELLPRKWAQATVDAGRVTRGAAVALKGMALLFDASPTMNYLETGAYEYDTERLKEALVPLSDIIENYGDIYELVNATTPEEYGSIFYSRNRMFSPEVIFGVPPTSQSDSFVEGLYRQSNLYNSMFSPQPYDAKYKKRNSVPTDNLVRKFETASGLSIADDTEYNEAKPYEGREPRFYYSILYDGVQWGYKNGKHLSFNTIGNIDKTDRWTGYYIRKYWPEDANDLNGIGNYKYQQNWIHIRLAGVYLNYAEAANEVYGPDVVPDGCKYSALQIVNMLRSKRAHVDVNPLYTANKDTFREKIRDERAVELCFEHNRWWDIRRWHIAHTPEVRKIYRMNKVKNVYVREEMKTLERVYEEKHYWYPLDRDDVDMMSNLKQNPGW